MTGRITSTPTNQGVVRRIHFAPPASPALDLNPTAGGALNARIAVLFSSGNFGVWELDAAKQLRMVAPIASSSTTLFWLEEHIALRCLHVGQHGCPAMMILCSKNMIC